jgi:DnaJ-class molecular chaperone
VNRAFFRAAQHIPLIISIHGKLSSNMVTSISHYDLLGVKQDATIDEIKTAYKRMCLAIHPDKNAYGAFLMQKVNAAKAVLLDESARHQYDRGEFRDHQQGRSGNGHVGSSSEVRRLQSQIRVVRSQLADSQQECRDLDRANRDLKVELYDKDQQIKELRQYNLNLEQESVENSQLRVENDLLQRKNRDKSTIIKSYEQKINHLSLELKKESIRSVCFRCDGKAVSGDCNKCQGHGTVRGTWTKCYNCNGMGVFLSFKGAKSSCGNCFGIGARQGNLSMVCFRCKGNPNEKCGVCYKGHLKGFNLRLCPFCAGKECVMKCENCLGKAFVACRCGLGCKGHGPNEILAPSSLQANLFMHNNAASRSFGVRFPSQNWNASSLQQASTSIFK